MKQLSLFDEVEPPVLEAVCEIFAESHRELRIARECPAIHVEFYPFVGINHTIRIRHGELFVRLSDLFQYAPEPVIKVLSLILLSKLFRRRIHPGISRTYQEFVNSAEMKRKSQLTRSKRGRKLLLDPQGRHFDLTALYDQINAEYFDSNLKRVNLGWSLRKSRRILGHFDPSHQSITISRLFDDVHVPEYVVSYILYHEMLHARFSVSSNFDLRNQHSPQFKKEEKKFKLYQESTGWLKKHL
jgi:hypothetical protein